MAQNQIETCPNCGAAAPGKFCSACGTALDRVACRLCSAALARGARFCHLCGAPQATPAKRTQGTLPWIIASGALVLLTLVLVVPVPSSNAGGASQPATRPGTPGPVAPDISSMTPREQADRLFQRAVTAGERGDTVEALEFASKTLTAYEMLDTLDEGARYRLALVHELRGSGGAALAEAEAIEATTPRHLFASVIRYRAARLASDTLGMRRAARRFLDDYESEIAVARPEYQVHRSSIDAFLVEARRAAAANQ